MSVSKVKINETPDLVLRRILAELHRPHLSALVYGAPCPVGRNPQRHLPRLRRSALLLTCHRFYDLVYELEDSLAKVQVYGTEQGALAQESFPCPRRFSRFQRWLPIVMQKMTIMNVQPRIDPHVARRLGMQQHRAVLGHKTILKALLTAQYLIEGLHWQWKCLETGKDREIERLLRSAIEELPIPAILAIGILSLMVTALNLPVKGHSFGIFRMFARRLPQDLQRAVCWRSTECFILSEGPVAKLPDLHYGRSVPIMFGPILEQVAGQASDAAFGSRESKSELARDLAQLHTIIDARIDECASSEYNEDPEQAGEKWNNLLSDLSQRQDVTLCQPDPDRSFEWTLTHFKQLTGTKSALELVREAREAIGIPVQTQ